MNWTDGYARIGIALIMRERAMGKRTVDQCLALMVERDHVLRVPGVLPSKGRRGGPITVAKTTMPVIVTAARELVAEGQLDHWSAQNEPTNAECSARNEP